MMRPIHRQFGSKARVAKQILALVPPGKRIWMELFAGTAAVTLAKVRHPAEHVNDLNGDIVNLFQVLRDKDRRARLIEAVDLTPWAEAEYHALRVAEPSGDPVEQARRYLVLSWQGFCGLSAKGTSWLSFDASSKTRPRTWHDLPERIGAAAERLKTVCVHQRDARELLERTGRYENAVVFADPPYPEHTINGRRQTYDVTMTEAEHQAFARACLEVDCSVILTMNRNTLYDEVLRAWWRTPLKVQTLSNKQVEEVIFTNFEPPVVSLFDRVEGL